MNFKNNPIFAISAICFSTALLIGCATKPDEVKKIRYQCERGTDLSVTFIEKGFTTVHGGRNSIPRYTVKNVAADISLPDGTVVRLPAQETGSGFIYSNGRYTLRGKGDEALWAVGRMAEERCLVNP